MGKYWHLLLFLQNHQFYLQPENEHQSGTLFICMDSIRLYYSKLVDQISHGRLYPLALLIKESTSLGICMRVRKNAQEHNTMTGLDNGVLRVQWSNHRSPGLSHTTYLAMKKYFLLGFTWTGCGLKIIRNNYFVNVSNGFHQNENKCTSEEFQVPLIRKCELSNVLVNIV